MLILGVVLLLGFSLLMFWTNAEEESRANCTKSGTVIIDPHTNYRCIPRLDCPWHCEDR